jgi:hypothetical protein
VARLAIGLIVVAVGACLPVSAQAPAPESPWPPPGGKLVLEDFEWCKEGQRPPAWVEYPEDRAGRSVAVKCEGATAAATHMALALEGTLPEAPRDPMVIEAARWLIIPCLASELILRVKGDLAGCHFHVRLLDAADETYGYVFVPDKPYEHIPADKWGEIRFPFDAEKSSYHFGGDGDGKFLWPLRLQSLGVVKLPETKAGGQYRVLIDEIACEIPEVEALPIEPCAHTKPDEPVPWKLTGANLGDSRLVLAPAEDRKGALCTWLEYAWAGGDTRPNSYAELLHPTPTGAKAGTVFGWLKGDGSGSSYTFRFEDATGEIMQLHGQGDSIPFRSWRCVFMDTLPSRRMHWIDHWGGNNDGVLDPPISFRSILIDDVSPAEKAPDVPASAAKGRIGFGPAWFVPWQ